MKSMSMRMAAGAVALVAMLGAMDARAASATWNIDGSANWSSNQVWNPNTGFPNGVGQVARLTNNITANRNVTNSTSVTVGSIIIGDNNNSANFLVLPANNSFITLDVSSGNATITKRFRAGGQDEIRTPLQLNDPLVVNNETAGNLLLSGAITGAASSAVTFQGNAGAQIQLSANNSGLQGNITVQNNVRLQATGNANALGRGTVTVNSGGQVWLNFNGTFTNAFVLNGNGWSEAAGFLGAIRFANNATMSGPVTLGSNIRLTAWGGGDAGTISGAIGGDYGIEKTGAGTLTLRGANAFTGGTAIRAVNSAPGTLLLDYGTQNNSKISATSALTMSNGTLRIIGNATAYTQVVAGLTLETASFNRIVNTNAGTATRLDFTANGGALNRESAGLLFLNVSGGGEVALPGTPNSFVGGWATLASGDFAYLDANNTVTAPSYTAFPGSGANGTTAYLLTGNQTVTASETAGYLKYAPVASGTALTIDGGQTLTLQSGGLIFDGTAAEGSITGTGDLTTPDSALAIMALGGNSLSIDAPITGNAALMKTGNGSVILLGENTYSGHTRVVEGSLTVGATDALKNSTLNLAQPDVGTVTVTADLNLGGLAGTRALNGGNFTLNIGSNNENTVYNGVLSNVSALTKVGSGVSQFGGANTFTGAVTVAEGTFRAGNGAALGTTNGITTVQSGATLDVNGQNLGYEEVFVSGSGVGGTGVVINTAGTQQQAFRRLTLEGDSTFGAYGRFDVRSAGSYLSTGGNDYDLTVKGAGGFYLVSAVVDPALGDITVENNSGLGYESGTTSLGNPAKTLSIGSNSYLQIYNATVPLDKQIVMANTAVLRSGAGGSDINASSNNVIWGNVQLDGTVTANMNGGSVRILGNVSGSGGWLKNGNNDLWLNGTNTYTGQTLIQAGRVIMVSTGGVNGMITGSSDIRIENGSLLLLNDRDGAAFDDHLGDSIPIALAGGGITMRGNNNYGNINEYAGALTLDGTRTSWIDMWNGTNTATDGTALLFASYTPGQTAWLNITKGTGAGTLGAGPTNSPDPHVFFGGQAEGVIPNTLVNGTNFARYSSANGVYAAAPTAAFNGAADQSGTDVNFNGARGAESDSLDADRSVWSITAANPDATRAAVDLAGNNLYIDQIMVNGTTNFSINNTGAGGSLQTTNLTSLQVFANTSTMTINAPITGAAGIRKTGNGNLILAGTNAYTGVTSLDSGNGSIVIKSSDALGSTVAGTVINGQNGTTGVSLLIDPGAEGVLTINEPLELRPNSVGRASLQNNSGTNTWAGTITLAGSNNLASINANNGLFTITGDITGDLGGQNLLLRGNGQGEMVGSINYTGNIAKTDGSTWLLGAVGETYAWSNTFVQVGTLRMGRADVLPSTTILTMGQTDGNSPLLDLNGFDQTVSGVTLVTSGGTKTIGNNNENAGSATLTIDNALDFTYGGVITDNNTNLVNLVKTGVGRQTLSGANTFHGATTVLGGVLEVAGQNALQNSTVSNTVADGLRFSGITSATFGGLAGGIDLALTNVAGGNVALTVGGNGASTTYGGVMDGGGSLVKIGNGLMILTNAQTYTGTTIVRGGNSGGLRLTQTASLGNGAITVDGNLNNGAALELEGDHVLANAFTLSARQQGTLNSAHVRNLSGTNLLSGTVNLTTGGSTYNYESVSGRLEISGQLTTPASGVRVLQLMGAGDGILSGVYSGNANPTAELNKMGAGTWTLTATNAYNGSTRILEGTLTLSGSGSIATSTNIHVASGAVFDVTGVTGGFSLASNQTLTGLGTVNGGLSLSEGATLSPGASPGLITVSGDLNAQAGSTIAFELASTNDYDRVIGIGALTLAGTINVTLFNAYNPTAGATFDLFDWSGALTDNGYTLNTPALDPGLSWDASNFETDGTLTVIPEPATVGLVGLMGLALLLRRRTRGA